MSFQLSAEGQNFVISREQSQFGIENIKAFAEFIADVTAKIEKYQADGNFSWIEKIRFGFDISEGVQFIAKIDKILQEVSDLQQSESDELAAFLNLKFGWDKEIVGAFISGVFIPALVGIKQGAILAVGIPAFYKMLKNR
jgi:hypothetical protein